MVGPLPHSPEGLLRAAHRLHARGWAPATSGNYSIRTPEAADTFLISRSGVDKGSLQTPDLLRVDLQGQPTQSLPEGHRPSAETLLHALVYRTYPQVTAVLHTHSVFNTVMGVRYASFRKHLKLRGYELQKAIGDTDTHTGKLALPLFANSQDMEKLSAKVGDYLAGHENPWGLLLVGHGLYAWGRSLAEACRHVEAFEFLIECAYRVDAGQSGFVH